MGKTRVLEPKHQSQCKNRANPMDYFLNLVSLCDAVAFRAFQDGMIGAGVAKEIKRAKAESKPVIELPFDTTQRELSIEQTRDRIQGYESLEDVLHRALDRAKRVPKNSPSGWHGSCIYFDALVRSG